MKKIISAAVAFCMLFCMLSFSAVAEVTQITIKSVYATTKAITVEFSSGVKLDYDEASEKYKNVIITDAQNTVLGIEKVTMSEDNKTAVIELETPFSITAGQQTNYTLSIPYLYSADGTAICFGTKVDITTEIYWQDDFESYNTANDLDSNYTVVKDDGYNQATPSSYTSDGQISLEKDAGGNQRLKLGFTSTAGLWIKKFSWNHDKKYYTFEADFEVVPTTNLWGVELATRYTSVNGNFKDISISRPDLDIFCQKEFIAGTTGQVVAPTSELEKGNKFTFGFTSTKVNDTTDSFTIYLNGAEKTSATGKILNDANGLFTIFGCVFGSQYYVDNWKMYGVTANETDGQTYALPKIENILIAGEFEENSEISCTYNETVSFTGAYSVNDEYQWFKGDDYFAEFPGDNWTALTQAVGNMCKLSAADLDSYVVCRVIRSINVPVGDDNIKLVLNDEKSQPIAKPAAPVCHNPEIKYEHTEAKDTLAFTYEYFDANMDQENGTVILWEESVDGNTWTASSLTPTETKDGNMTKSEIDVTDITDKYFRCSVTVKNAEPNFGDKAETVTLSYVMPFRPVINGIITVSGNAQVGSILTADYDYFDANGDEEVGSEIMWIRKDSLGNETVVSKNSYSYLIQQADSGCSIAFAVIPKNTSSKDGDKTYSSFLSVPVYVAPSYSGGGSSGGSSSYVGYKDISVLDEETNTTDKPTTNVKFTDIESHWAYNEITALIGKGYIKGKSENTFAPEDKITRAEWLTLLLRCADIDTDSEYSNCFDDVGKDDWYAKTVQKAYELGFISGDNGNFNANDIVTREQMAKMIISVYEYKTQKTAVASSLDGFSDNSDLSKWAEEYMEKAVGMEFIKGVTDNSLSPLSYATRAQSAVILLRFIDKL